MSQMHGGCCASPHLCKQIKCKNRRKSCCTIRVRGTPGNSAVASTGSKLLGIALKHNSCVWSYTMLYMWNHMNTTCICHMCWLLQRTRLRNYGKFPEPLRSTLIDLPSFSDEGTECEDANQPVVHRDVTCIPVLKTWGKHANSVNEDCFTGSRLI